ncbi:MAG: HAD hydrolase family protein [Thermoguttaceae bacterium]|nr:HAD hydrolase family protein [Thermoguttaceae bacterium]MDW8079760.1 HAD hydrolase family protein [Thermoguttaceae bacterium]
MVEVSQLSEEIRRRCEKVAIILSDVDGVLTDGYLILDNHGHEAQRFHIRDGLGIRLWQQAGFPFGILSHRSSQSLRIRAAELGIQFIRQSVESKLTAAREILAQCRLGLDELCYIGDDLLDLPLLRRVGLAVAVADAVPEVRAVAHIVTEAPGGAGAVREIIEVILKTKDRWEPLVASLDR